MSKVKRWLFGALFVVKDCPCHHLFGPCYTLMISGQVGLNMVVKSSLGWDDPTEQNVGPAIIKLDNMNKKWDFFKFVPQIFSANDSDFFLICGNVSKVLIVCRLATICPKFWFDFKKLFLATEIMDNLLSPEPWIPLI